MKLLADFGKGRTGWACGAGIAFPSGLCYIGLRVRTFILYHTWGLGVSSPEGGLQQTVEKVNTEHFRLFQVTQTYSSDVGSPLVFANLMMVSVLL